MTLNATSSKPNLVTALYLMFKIELDYYALAATQIEFVLSRRRLKQIPAAPSWMVGLLNINDQTIPVIDIYQRLLARPASAQSSTRLVIVRYENDKLLGLLLEKVNTFERLNICDWTNASVELYNNNFLAAVQQHPTLGLIQNIALNLLLPNDVKQQLYPKVTCLPSEDGDKTLKNITP